MSITKVMRRFRFVDPNYVPKGQLEGFPLEVIDKMLENQQLQGNDINVRSFEFMKCESKTHGGFDWGESIDAEKFWSDVIRCKDFDHFFKKYPKENWEELPDNWVVQGDGTSIGILAPKDHWFVKHVDIKNFFRPCILENQLYTLFSDGGWNNYTKYQARRKGKVIVSKERFLNHYEGKPEKFVLPEKWVVEGDRKSFKDTAPEGHWFIKHSERKTLGFYKFFYYTIQNGKTEYFDYLPEDHTLITKEQFIEAFEAKESESLEQKLQRPVELTINPYGGTEVTIGGLKPSTDYFIKFEDETDKNDNLPDLLSSKKVKLIII